MSSLAELVGFCATQQGGKYSDVAKTLKNELKLNENVYNQMICCAFARAQQQDKLQAYIEMAKPPCSHTAIGEICYSFGLKELAKSAFLKIKDPEPRVGFLIEYQYWEDAVKQVFQNKLQDEFMERL